MVYTFYPCRSDGSSMAFDAAELADDDAAIAYARKVLSRHQSAVEVAVWDGERSVVTIARESAAEMAAE